MQTAPRLPVEQIMAALANGLPQDAESACRAFLVQVPGDETAALLLGMSLQHQSRSAEAAEIHRDLTQRFPNWPGHWNNLGTALREAGKLGEAEQAYRQALRLAPRSFDYLMNLGYLFLEREIYPSARDCFLDAHAIDPTSPTARVYAAQLCETLDDRSLAERLLEPWRQWRDLDEDLSLELAIALAQLDWVDDSLGIFERLLQENPHNYRAIAHQTLMLERANKLDAARALLARLPPIDASVAPALREEITEAHVRLALRERDPADARALIERLLQAEAPDSGHRSSADLQQGYSLYFSLAQVCDREGDAAAAMDALRNAHERQVAAIGRSMPELLAPDAELLTTATKWISAPLRASWPDLTAPSAKESPIFIVGFPRSGTTMLEQMLDAHAQMRSMDERAFLQNLVERLGTFGYTYPFDLHKLDAAQCDELRELYWKLTAQVAPLGSGQRLVDKNPLNMLRLPLINRLFPDAPIIMALRHPCDVVLSCYMQHFRSLTFGMLCSTPERLAQGYVDAMRFWIHHAELLKPNVINLRYEDLLEDFDGHVQRIGRFLGLDDSAALANFHRHARDKGYIGTPSYAQVIEPPHKKAIGRWHRYREYFEQALPILRPMLDHWGYDV
ncbi:MAG: sulfotransferase [Rudaea sp.]|uniref:tetratricopeptide repeat-containing sulfotransferase family protein n=1 Tax=unclassified Rudaea TaxID=2627037 RepID=UPI0010F89950|nr:MULTISPECIES: sulfotransferase family protein [unclassified Rudaea]MBN8888353.1 sulfotransferase [Rudaea sp.]MBR0344968.1 sulfotransferase [Rudaea sp.]